MSAKCWYISVKDRFLIILFNSYNLNIPIEVSTDIVCLLSLAIGVISFMDITIYFDNSLTDGKYQLHLQHHLSHQK